MDSMNHVSTFFTLYILHFSRMMKKDVAAGLPRHPMVETIGNMAAQTRRYVPPNGFSLSC